VLVGNKIDLEDERTVNTDDGKKLAEKFACSFVEASAKMNTNVGQVFFELVRQINNWRRSRR
jgi:GTPase SAR1 family protein